MQVLRNLFSCFQPHYDQLLDQSVKKDDDLGVEEASSWIQLNPVNQDISHPPDIKEKAKLIIAGLKKIPLTDSNYLQIRNHLKALAKTSTMFRYYLAQELENCKIKDSVTKADLLSAVEMTYTQNL